MSRARTAVAGAGLLVLGAAVGTATVWVHPVGWGLALGAAATLAALVAAPAGWRRLAYGVGWVVAAGWFVFARPEGDFVISSDPAGYAVLGLGLVVVVLVVATVPGPRRRSGPA